MPQTQAVAPDPVRSGATERFDAVVIGAGMSGLYQLHLLRRLGLRTLVIEAGSGVGGTWYWNRYPGARFDSESYTYGYSFSPEILAEWEWQEHFAAQPETLRYLEFVADRLDLRRDIRFGTRVDRARYDAEAGEWDIETARGDRVRAQFLITAVGVLSAPYIPEIEGRATFRGGCWHTAEWPQTPVDLAGRRVAVIGTGATGIQLITALAPQVGHLTIFQRTPNFTVPMRNRPITAAEQRELKADHARMFARCRETFGAFLHDFDPRSALEVTPAARLARFEELWAQPGFRFWLGNFHDIMTDRRANDLISEFVREKIRARVRDPAVAERLVPRDHGFGTRRVPLESGYYEVYNRDNVTLVDLRETPLLRMTPNGLATTAGEFDFDYIFLATGFDAVTGALNRIDIRGIDDVALREKWANGPLTYLGLQCAGFPNLFTVIGPHNAGNFCNVPRCIEQNVEWIANCIRWLRAHGYSRIAATPAAEEAWRAHVEEVARGSLVYQTDSWITGANVPGKKRGFLPYAGGLPNYRRQCDDAAARGYAGFEFS